MAATQIRRLPTALANKIAAGEVVERPASIVKELVENALDAGARRITVTLQAGGRRLVRVTDDGCGMAPDDAILCVERHATSKIAADADLDRIGTFGFRGEALPSIAAVSKFELVTRAGDALAGTQVAVEGGSIQDVREVGAPPGTTVAVRQLFFNVPARAKFLKSRETELSHCLTVVQQAALAHPGVAFRLDHNGRLALDLPSAEDPLTRIGQIWGAEVAHQLRPMNAAGPGFQVAGFIAGPDLTRANRSLQLVFVNERPVFNATIAHAITEAYHGRLMVGRYPVVFLFLTMDPHFVDVNVHPTKREVRFRRSEPVHQAVIDGIRDAFGTLGHPAPAVAPPAAPVDAQAGYAPLYTRGPDPLTQTALPSTVTTPSHREIIERVEIAATTAAPEAEPCDLGRPGGPLPPPREELGEPLDLTADFAAEIPPYQFLAQIFQTYLLCVHEDTLVVLDQHAVHERILYETFVARAAQTAWKMQRLLLPRVMEFSPDQSAVLADNLDLFAQIGIEIEGFGEHAFAVTAASGIHADTYLEQLVRDSVQELSQGRALRAPRDLLGRLLTISACKNAIKAGQVLSPAEAQVVLDGLRLLPRPPTCLHGRPLVLRITKQELDRRFGRLGSV